MVGSAPSLVVLSPAEVVETLSRRPWRLVAVVSFEDRCTAVASDLAKGGLPAPHLVLVDYVTSADPSDEDSIVRERHRGTLGSCFASAQQSVVPPQLVNPYSMTALEQLNHDMLVSAPEDTIVLDISCMTRVHVLTLARLLSTSQLRSKRLFLGYTTPNSYGRMGSRHGWRDTIHIQLGEVGALRREGHARGVVVLGHDPERLGMALNELEPASGTLLAVRNSRRPDFYRRAIESNTSIRDRLLSLRMPRPPEERASRAAEGWKEVTVNIADFRRTMEVVGEEAAAASNDDGPVVLFPLGPKPIVLAAGMALASFRQANPWAVYTIPERYDVRHSEGADLRLWMGLV